jgi:hypothetical protein
MLTVNTFEDKDQRRLSKPCYLLCRHITTNGGSCVVSVCGKGGIIVSYSQNVLGYPEVPDGNLTRHGSL